MKISKAQTRLGFVCFVLGIATVLLAQRLFERHPKSPFLLKTDAPSTMSSVFNQFYNDDFFNQSRDPFEQMKQMRSHLMKQFDEPDRGAGVFDSWFQGRFGGGNIGDIKRREDKDFGYYDVAIEGLDKRDFNFKIADGQISISGRLKKMSDENGSGTYFSSSFHRSFPVPAGVDAKKVQIEQDQNRVTLKFPKV